MKKMASVLALICLVTLLFSLAGCSRPEVKIAAKADLDGKIIGVQEGTIGDDIATKEISAKSVERFTQYVDAITSLQQKKIDAIVMDMDTAAINVSKSKDLVVLDVGFEPEQYAIAVNKGQAELLAAIDRVIDEMKTDGSLQASMDSHAEEAGAAPDYNTGAAGGQLVMGTEAGFAPYEYMDGQNVIGVDVDIMARVAKSLDMELVVENMPFNSLISALNGGKIDVIAAGMTINEERKVNVDFSSPYVDATQVVVIRKASQG